jgi:[heparan sulfate]-glucosamine 3-sulfotransferase 3
MYAEQLERYLQYFPLSQILIVSGERFVSNPASEFYKIQDFLGLKRAITKKHFYFNSKKGFYCLIKPGNHTQSRSTPHCMGKGKGRKHLKVDPQALERLRDFYRPFNEKFYQLIGIDFLWP